MLELVVVGVAAGVVAGISPCILPVLPVILVSGTGRPAGAGGARRAVAVVTGLVASFSLVVLAGSEVLSALGLPQGALRDAGIAVLAVTGASFLWPPLGLALERPFARWTPGRRPGGTAGGLVLGVGLGLLFVPCAGPILAAITVAGATHRVGWTAVALTVAFAAGAAVPLLAVALAGRRVAARVATLRRGAPHARRVSGVVVVAMAVAIALDAFSGVQRDVPGYTAALQTRIEGGPGVRRRLAALDGGHDGTAGATLASCNPAATALADCGPAPDFAGISAWLDTGGRPLSLPGLRGRVVLVDFWTYSCINCQRTLPHVEAWYADYARDGLVVVGVHTPEFPFEHVVANVAGEAAALGVHYPVAVDDGYKTWDAYDNEYWPAEYLIDAAGEVRHVSFGEGGYADTERLIRQLLVAAHPGLGLPAPTGVPDTTPAGAEDPETYVGYAEEQYVVNGPLVHDAPAVYRFPPSVPLAGLALSGTWTDGAQDATAGPSAEMELHYAADDVYLVLGGTGTVSVSLGGRPRTIAVGGVPRLYTLLHGTSESTGTMRLRVSPGVAAYDFTFG